MPGERNGEPVAQTVARVKSGDGDAVRVLYAAYRDSVFGYLLSMLRDPSAAQDVAERVFLELTSVIHTYDARQVPFSSWLLRAARTAALDHLRRPRAAHCAEVCVLLPGRRSGTDAGCAPAVRAAAS